MTPEDLARSKIESEGITAQLKLDYLDDIYRLGDNIIALYGDILRCTHAKEALEIYKSSGETKLLSSLEYHVELCGEIERRHASLLKEANFLLKQVNDLQIPAASAHLEKKIAELTAMDVKGVTQSTAAKPGLASRIGTLFKKKAGVKRTRRTKGRGKHTRKH
jgi:hydrogenase maturation factor